MVMFKPCSPSCSIFVQHSLLKKLYKNLISEKSKHGIKNNKSGERVAQKLLRYENVKKATFHNVIVDKSNLATEFEKVAKDNLGEHK